MTRCPVCATPLESGDYVCPGCGARLITPTHGPTEVRGPTARSKSGEANADPALAHGRFLPGTVIADRYRIVERIGRGGMGEVYRADDLHLMAPVALKFLPAAMQDDPTERQRLRDEVRTARQISHLNVCRVHDIGELDRVPFLTMEFVDGEDLESLLLRIGRLSPDKAYELAREICAGLKAIHDGGVVHRDLKPGNIMIDGRGHARITDFGLALHQLDDSRGPEVAGTPGYMAPETIQRGEVSPRSDLYSLGLVLHELFTGQHALRPAGAPRGAGTPQRASPQPLRRPEPAIERVIQRCLEREPSRRPSSVDEVAALLPGHDPLEAAIRAGETPSPEEVGAGLSAPLTKRGAWGLFAIVCVGIAVLGLVGSRGRLIPQLAMPDPPAVLEARARDHLRALGIPFETRTTARGFLYARDRVEHIAATDNSVNRWHRLWDERPAPVRFWYRASPSTLEPWHWKQQVSPNDPPLTVPGMVLAELDTRGRLERLAVVPDPRVGASDSTTPDWRALFVAASLDSARFHAVAPRDLPTVYAETRRAWEGTDASVPATVLHLEASATRGHVVSFAMTPADEPSAATAAATGDGAPSNAVRVRAILLVLGFLLAAWLARRHLRAGKGDRKRAVRAASVVMGLRFSHWVLSGHPVAGDVPGQFALALAWALYDFAYLRIFYLAVEPYVRRLWPRILISWVRLIDARFRDPILGRDLLVGTTLGVLLCLGTVAHRSLPTLWGAASGRPDNVGFVEPTLNTMMGMLPLLAQDIESLRSAIILSLCFAVVLVVARLGLRRDRFAVPVAFVLFALLGMPMGETPWLNLLFAAINMSSMLFVLFRYGLVAATVALTVNSVLQSTPFHGTPAHWSAPSTMLQLALVVGGAAWALYSTIAPRGRRRAPLNA